MALNYSAIDSITQKKYMPELIDNIFNSNPLLSFLRDRQKTYDGGTKIVEPLIYAELGGAQSYSGYDLMNYDTGLPITAAEFEPRNLAGTIIFSKDEELKNMGESQVQDLVEAKMKIVEMSLKKEFITQLLSDGTGNGSKDITGLAAMFSATNTYGGINRTEQAWWKPIIKGNGGSVRALTELLMLDAFMDASDGDDQPEVIFTSKKGWQQYYLLVKGRITLYTESVKKSLGLGFQTLEFMGRPVIMDTNLSDTNCPFYFLNMKYIKLRAHKAANFTQTKWRPDDSRLAMKKEILWTGNLTCNQPRREALLTDINPAGITA